MLGSGPKGHVLALWGGPLVSSVLEGGATGEEKHKIGVENIISEEGCSRGKA